MISIIKGKRDRQAAALANQKKRSARLLLSVLLALALWQAGTMLFSRYMGLGSFLVAPPAAVFGRLLALLTELSFWHRLWFSFFRILIGFFSALILAALLATAASRFSLLETLLWPYITVVKTTPVASFVILCLIWIGSANLSAVISFLMVLPIVYSNMLEGIRSTDLQLLEMADVFGAGWSRRILYIYLPQLKPYLISACSVSLGMTWKSGIAAEVIGIPGGSIGEMLYEAKIYLNARDLFAWTAIIILLSAAFEKLFMAVLQKSYRRLETMESNKSSGDVNAAAAMAAVSGTEMADCTEDLCQDCPNDHSTGPPEGAMPDILISGLHKTYTDKQVLRDYSAVFPAGQCTCIMGDSGVGKTTLFRILMGLTDADAGSISGVEGLKPSAVFQENRLCESLNAVANVRFACGNAVTGKRIRSQLTALGLENSMYQPVRELSGGMRRRVAIVRAIAAGGDILYLDEPLKGLDEQNKETVVAYIRNHANGRTILMVTHNADEVERMGGRLQVMQGV